MALRDKPTKSIHRTTQTRWPVRLSALQSRGRRVQVENRGRRHAPSPLISGYCCASLRDTPRSRWWSDLSRTEQRDRVDLVLNLMPIEL